MVDSFKQIAIGCDHAGFDVKEYIKMSLEKFGHTFHDFGAFSDSSMDYPDTAHPLAKAVQSGEYEYGILICGSGNGVAIVANKYTGIRAAICWNEEITRLARQHNNANIIVLPARFITHEEAVEFVQLFLATRFEGGRHQVRVDKISNIL
ncbi:MAG: ribose 5-phosphate isomerase B [Bacteroidales bacterium]